MKLQVHDLSPLAVRLAAERKRLDKLPGKSSSDQRGSVWLAPSMQYLPVRIKLTQGQDDFVDLQLKKYLPAPQ